MHHIARTARTSSLRLAPATRSSSRALQTTSLHFSRYQNHDERSNGSTLRNSPTASSGPKDAANLSSKHDPDVHSSPASSTYQPGQHGEQVGGQLHGVAGKGSAGSVGEQKGARTEEKFMDKVKGVLGIDDNKTSQKRGFSTVAARSKEGDTKAREIKDEGVREAQTPHLRHHKEGEGDRNPAVRDNAALPSKGGSGGGAVQGSGEAATEHGRTGVHQPSWEPQAGKDRLQASDKKPTAVYTHVKGTPEPTSTKENYVYVKPESESSTPTGAAPRSSSSTYPPHPVTTQEHGHPQNEGGIGSSNKIHRLEDVDPSKVPTETGHGGRPYAAPSDQRAAKEDLGGFNPRHDK